MASILPFQDESDAINEYLRDINHLIMLPCHAIYKGKGSGEKMEDWFMEDFQKEAEDQLSWIKQIEKCLELLVNDSKSIMIISGGKTKRVGNISESFSYLNLILQNKKRFLGDYNEEIINRIYLEEFAKDSLDNFAYSVYRYQEVTGEIPIKLTIVGYKFKEERFVNYHKIALNYNGELYYVGIDPYPVKYLPEESESFKNFFKELQENEEKYALNLFKKDPLALNSPLKDKKRIRNPYNIRAPYHNSTSHS